MVSRVHVCYEKVNFNGFFSVDPDVGDCPESSRFQLDLTLNAA